MEFDRNTEREVAVLLGAGSMGTAIMRRVGAGRIILLGDISEKNLEAAAAGLMRSGYAAEQRVVDAKDPGSVKDFAQYAASLGPVKFFVDTAGASPNQAKPEHIIGLDLIGTAYALDAFGEVMARGGAGLVISSQAGYMPNALTAEQIAQLRTAPTEQLGSLPFLAEGAIPNSGAAYIIAKIANRLRVQYAAAGSWAERGARVNSISPGIIVTPLAYDEFEAEGAGYQQMIDASAARRVGTSDEIAEAAAFLLGDNAKFITGADLLIDGGVIAAIDTGRFQLNVH